MTTSLTPLPDALRRQAEQLIARLRILPREPEEVPRRPVAPWTDEERDRLQDLARGTWASDHASHAVHSLRELARVCASPQPFPEFYNRYHADAYRWLESIARGFRTPTDPAWGPDAPGAA